MKHPELYYFWSDLNAYPGNSGRPVIHKSQNSWDSSQAFEDVEDDESPEEESFLNSVFLFGKIIKTKYIFELIEKHIDTFRDVSF